MIENYQRLLALYKQRLESIERAFTLYRQQVLACENQVRLVQSDLADFKAARQQLVNHWQGIELASLKASNTGLDARAAQLKATEILSIENSINEALKRESESLQHLAEARQAMEGQAMKLRKQTRKCELLEEKLHTLQRERKRLSDRKQENAIEDRFGIQGLRR